MINETTNFNSQVMVQDSNGVDTAVMYLNATLDNGNMNVSISASTTNKTLAAANAVTVKAQYDEFMAAVMSRAAEMGYVIF